MMNLLGRVSVFFCLLALVANPHSARAQDEDVATEPPEGWAGCVDPSNPDALVTIGEEMTICLVVADGFDWSNPRTYMRLNFQPKADEYSRFHVPQSYQQLVKETENNVNRLFTSNVTVHVSSQASISFQKWYYNGNSRVFPYLTAVVDVQDGVVVGIAWDDASVFCGKRESEPNTFDYKGFQGDSGTFGQPVDGCFLSRQQCEDSEDDTLCDLRLYVVWTGTDSKGRSFLSSAKRFSAFPAQKLLDRIGNNIPELKLDIDVNPFDNDEE